MNQNTLDQSKSRPDWTTKDGRSVLFDPVTGKHLKICPHDAGSHGVFWRLLVLHEFNNQKDWIWIGSSFDTEIAAKEDGLDYIDHLHQLQNLPRPTKSWPQESGPSTPWGPSQNRVTYGPDIHSYSTAGHGGFILNEEQNAKIHEAWRTAGAYEEDCEWAIVAYSFPDLFTTREHREAIKSLIRWYPHEYATVSGKAIATEDSYVLRQEKFARDHANDIVAVAAVMLDDRSLCKVWATLGGDRSRKDELYAVPTAEYNTRSEFGFIVDPARHPIYDQGVHGPG